MCGNWGMITDTNNKNTRDFMKMGLYVDALRGRHSTGLATIDHRDEIEINKRALDANDFLTLPAVDKQIMNHQNRVFIGHNRHATRGSINNINAHPFQHGKITMVHNGSLTQTHNLPDHMRFEVDSENIAHSLNTIGTLDTLKRLYGAFALVWWDAEEKRVKMARNSERPLTLANIKGSNTVIWGSEYNMLQFVAARSGLKIEEIWSLPENTVASFDPKSKDIWECDIQEDVEYYKHTYPNYNRNTNGFRQGKYDQGGTKDKEKGAKEAEKGGEEATTKAKERDILNQRMFNRCGLKKGSTVELSLYNFTPYNAANPDSGYWDGCTLDNPYVSAIVYGSRSDNYAAEKIYLGEALCMQLIDSDGDAESKMNYRLVVDHQSVVCLDEDSPTESGNTHEKSNIILVEEKPVVIPEKKRTAEEKKAAVQKLLTDMEEKVGKERAKKEAELGGGAKKKSILTTSGKIEAGSSGDGEFGKSSSDVDFLYLMGASGLAIPYAEWLTLTKHGCGMCARDISPTEAKDVLWMGDTGKDPVCPDCAAEAVGIVKEEIGKFN